MHRLRVELIAFALITAGCSKNPTVHFGAIEGDRVRDTTRIEHRLGNKYGYRIDFPKRMGIVRLREEFSLPAAAEWKRNTDAQDPNVTLKGEQKNAGGSKAVHDLEFDTSDGKSFFSTYTIIEGDPKGSHVIKLWLNDQPLRTIQFQID